MAGSFDKQAIAYTSWPSKKERALVYAAVVPEGSDALVALTPRHLKVVLGDCRVARYAAIARGLSAEMVPSFEVTSVVLEISIKAGDEA
jgi:hypothetical protein